jgi:hypothetical protein
MKMTASYIYNKCIHTEEGRGLSANVWNRGWTEVLRQGKQFLFQLKTYYLALIT